MKLHSIAGIANIVFLLEYTFANNLHQVEQTSRVLDTPCGNGVPGSTYCADSSHCCSQYGWCGTSADHCDGTYPMRDDNIIPCGNGVVGNTLCADSSHCCSQYGWCGTAATGHCDGTYPFPGPSDPPDESPLEPTPAPIMPTTPHDGSVGKESRLIAYLGGWTPCPTDQQLEQYTHIMLAFAVSYQWSPGKNICSTTCEIATPPVCNNDPRPDLIQKWQDARKKIILSFGGAGMGGSWASSPDDCWEYCFGKEGKVVDRLTDIVDEMGIDGVDIDYEYYYEDGQNESNFGKGAEAQKFLKDVTVGLRTNLPEGAEVTHAPMDSDMVPGKGYYNVLREVADSLDFLMPQYYNGIVNPTINFSGAVQHFRTLKDDMFGGDASKIVFGFCISECSSYNINGQQAASVMKQLSLEFPCNGGVFFWDASYDGNGDWSKPVSNQIQINSDQCSVDELTEEPIAICEDDMTFFKGRTKKGRKRGCWWVAKKMNRCDKKKKKMKLSHYCPETCGVCRIF
jgi:hypothetical protein